MKINYSIDIPKVSSTNESMNFRIPLIKKYPPNRMNGYMVSLGTKKAQYSVTNANTVRADQEMVLYMDVIILLIMIYSLCYLSEGCKS